MKVAVYHNLNPGGAKRVLYEQLKYLTGRSHKLSVFELENDDNKFNLRDIVDEVYRYKLDIKSYPMIPKRISSDVQTFYRLYKINKIISKHINKNSFDITYVNTDVNIEAPFLLRWVKTPTLYFDQEMLAIVYSKFMKFDMDVFLVNRLYEKLYRYTRKVIDLSNTKYAGQIVTQSKYMRSFIKGTYGMRSKVCYPGVDANIFHNSDASQLERQILFIGNTKSRVFDLVSESIKNVNKDMEIKLEVLSSSSKEMTNNKDDQLANIYSRSIATICTVPFEAFGLKAIESMACETPVLAVNEGGYRETVIDGVTGFLLPRDPRAFAEKIEWLVNNPDKARRMGKAGRELVKKNFTWEKHNKCIEKILLETAGK